MLEDEEMPSTPGWFGEGILQNGVDQGATRRAAIREANAVRRQAELDTAALRAQERAERLAARPPVRKPAPPPAPPPLARIHPDGLALLLDALR